MILWYTLFCNFVEVIWTETTSLDLKVLWDLTKNSSKERIFLSNLHIVATWNENSENSNGDLKTWSSYIRFSGDLIIQLHVESRGIKEGWMISCIKDWGDVQEETLKWKILHLKSIKQFNLDANWLTCRQSIIFMDIERAQALKQRGGIAAGGWSLKFPVQLKNLISTLATDFSNCCYRPNSIVLEIRTRANFSSHWKP
jgi:hypothetical protein